MKTTGKRYQVVSCSGVDSNRIGTAVKKQRYDFWKTIPGLYTPVDYKRETVLRDDKGKFFTMFDNRLKSL